MVERIVFLDACVLEAAIDASTDASTITDAIIMGYLMGRTTTFPCSPVRTSSRRPSGEKAVRVASEAKGPMDVDGRLWALGSTCAGRFGRFWALVFLIRGQRQERQGMGMYGGKWGRRNDCGPFHIFGKGRLTSLVRIRCEGPPEKWTERNREK